MAHSFNFPAPNYQRSFTDELYSPLTDINIPTDTHFSRTQLANNSVSCVPNVPPHSYKNSSGLQTSHQPAEAILKAATHYMLMAAHNQAHTELYDEYMRGKYQLEAQIKLVAELKDELKDTRDLVKTLSSSRSRDDDLANDREPKTWLLKVPKSPPTEKEDDHPDVRFWHQKDWTVFESRARNRNEHVDKLHFLCDESGEMISKMCRDEMTETAKMAFNELFYWRLDPHTWTKWIRPALQFISTTMRAKFPEFRWCKRDWKVHEFAKIRYPDWTRHYREPGKLTRAKPSIGKHSTESNIGPMPKKRRLNRPPPATKEVIEIESDNPSSSRPSTPDFDSLPVALPLHMGPAHSPTHVSASMSTPSGSGRSTPAGSLSTSSTTSIVDPHTGVTSLEPGQDVLGTTATSSAESITADSILTSAPQETVTPPPTLPTTPPRPNSVTNAVVRTPTSPSLQAALAIELLPSQLLVPIVDGEVLPGTATRRSRFNPLAGLKVPRPPFEVNPPPATMPSIPTTGQMKAKKGKLMVPSTTSLTARNLYALDYVEDHKEDPVTVVEFRDIYNNLAPDIVKRYEALSKERKAAMTAPPAPTGS